ncbi:hypothetical protein [Streptomyces sp. 150FB]|uniref:hypothetical protein n=1 Tax=Streptomyces sp. 150FB TaxID=1576605 RepID=UPI000697FC49|nr:hypothetical protein [Streptomyces sp. 150FB]
MPDGKKLTQQASDAGPESPRCRLVVDRKDVVYIAGDVIPSDTDPVKVDERGLLRMGNPAPVAIGDEGRLADKGALAVARCTYKGEQRKFVALVQLELQESLPEKTPERRDALAAFLRSYFPKAMEKQGCTGS